MTVSSIERSLGRGDPPWPEWPTTPPSACERRGRFPHPSPTAPANPSTTKPCRTDFDTSGRFPRTTGTATRSRHQTSSPRHHGEFSLRGTRRCLRLRQDQEPSCGHFVHVKQSQPYRHHTVFHGSSEGITAKTKMDRLGGPEPALPTKCDRSQNVGWAVPTNSQANVVGKAHPTI